MAIPRATFSCDTESVEETERLGSQLGECAIPSLVVLLIGPLGAGKTALARGIARGLGYEGYVRSPTFTLIHHYHGRLPMFHFDLYRLENSLELEELGFEEYFFGEGVSVVEWADRVPEAWPDECLVVGLSRHETTDVLTHEDQRRLAIEARGSQPIRVLECTRNAWTGSSMRGGNS